MFRRYMTFNDMKPKIGYPAVNHKYSAKHVLSH